MKQEQAPGWVIGVGVTLLVLLILAPFWAWPKYRVWQRELAGRAELAQAEWNRQIKVQEANAQMEASKLIASGQLEASKLLAIKDSVDAMGVASANRILGQSLENNEAYLHYLWITQALGTGEHDVIYVPTEAGLPILEAGRFGKP